MRATTGSPLLDDLRGLRRDVNARLDALEATLLWPTPPGGGNPLTGLFSMRMIAERWGVSRQRVHQVLQTYGVTIWTSEAFGKVGVVRDGDVKRVERERRNRGLTRPGERA